MQRPTCTNTRICTTEDAHRVFHAAGFLGLPMVYRRLDAEERRFIRPGSVFVWEERSTTSEAAGLGIERWTDGLRWGPSRVRDFLFYQEKFTKAEGNDILTKQTYSAWVDLSTGPKKWHLTAYFTPRTINDLGTVDDIPCLRNLKVPEGMYRRSRSGKRKADARRQPAIDEYYSGSSPPPREPGSPRHESGRYPLYMPFESQGPPPSPPFAPVSPTSSDPQDDETCPWNRPRERAGYVCSTDRRLESNSSAALAPLSYLESIRHPRRNPADEVALRAFASFN